MEEVKVINWDEWTCRCSSLGYIMTEPKGKSNMQKYEDLKKSISLNESKYDAIVNKNTKTANALDDKIQKMYEKLEVLEFTKDIPTLSESAKTHLCDVYVAIKYGRHEDIMSKYLEKGTQMEEDAITLYSLVTGEYFEKNERRINGTHFQGEIDFEDDSRDMICDTKVNWSIFQFFRTIARKLSKRYEYQLQGYMELFGRENARLIYALIDTPEHLIVREEKKMLYEFIGSKEDWELACAELRKNHTYSDIPQKDRLICYNIERDQELIDRMKKRVEDCRLFLKQLDSRESQLNDEDDE